MITTNTVRHIQTCLTCRNMNELCQYMNFFDNHDMWHFLSATSLFLAFIFLLTIDDDLLLIDRHKITVF